MQLQEKPQNKAETRATLQTFLLEHCDRDIRVIFGPHFFTLEPLLLQLIREIRLVANQILQAKEEGIVLDEHYDDGPEGALLAPVDATGGNDCIESTIASEPCGADDTETGISRQEQ